MKKIPRVFFILVATAISHSSIAYSQQISGELSCKITGSSVISSEEGKFQRYSHINDGVKDNDSTILKYTFSKNSVHMRMGHSTEKEKYVISSYISITDPDTRFEQKNQLLILSGKHDQISFSGDYIRIENIFGRLFLKRYYKNDWHGIFTYLSVLELTAQSLTFNCRHYNDKNDEVFNLYKTQK
jgi:hypothetical protein